jgi:hypothetical protein
MTDDEYRNTIDAEAVARKPWPDLSKVRRVRIEDEPTPQQSRITREARDE